MLPFLFFYQPQSKKYTISLLKNHISEAAPLSGQYQPRLLMRLMEVEFHFTLYSE